MYRFAPMLVTDVDRRRLHGTDERVAVADVARAVRFYQALLLTSTR